jgi:endogenous inhibitor of DNA gyrase (YacG/DUF329 family)
VRFTCPICPTCSRELEGTRAEIPTLPFCSPRCRAADLGSWLNEGFRISSPVAEEDLDAGLPAGARSGDETDGN